MSTVKSSSANLTLNADGSGNDIILQSNGSTKAIITAEGTAGIGTATPSRNLTVSSTGQTDLAIIAGTGDSAQLCFGDSGDDNIGQIEYNNADNTMAFYTNATEAMEIGSSGDITAKTGDIVFGTAGKGICLGVTSNTDANTLDDYEEGTWTPDVVNNGQTSTWANIGGNYIKVGSLVHAWGKCDGGNSGTAGTYLILSGLPFSINMDTNNMILGNWGSNNTTVRNGNVFLNLKLVNGTSDITEQATFISFAMSYVTNS